MMPEHNRLASVSGVLAVSLREVYGIDPDPVFAAAGIGICPPDSPPVRCAPEQVNKLWRLARKETDDPLVGLKTGFYAEPWRFYALGYSWMASSTLLDALNRAIRYQQLVSAMDLDLHIARSDLGYTFSWLGNQADAELPPEASDCGLTTLLHMCDLVARSRIVPVMVDVPYEESDRADAYRDALRAPLRFGRKIYSFHFDEETVNKALPTSAPDIAQATDKVADRYVERLDPHHVATMVRRQLISLLPSGKATQQQVAQRLHRSTSTLQRQLKAEGCSFRKVLEMTRRNLAEDYLGECRYSLAEIAYLLGYSDQSNFTRAFRAWTNMAPREYQETLK